MVSEAGYVDTLDENVVNLHSTVIDALNNPYSAMPSLHASYAVVVGVFDLAAGAAALLAAPLADRAVVAIIQRAGRRDADASWLGAEWEQA